MNKNMLKIDWLILPLFGIAIVIGLWAMSSATWAKELPSPAKTWEKSKEYVLEPFAKRGEMDQGILRFTWHSLSLVAKGYAIALLVGTPLGFLLGLSLRFKQAFDPIFQVLRPVSPLAWFPLGLVLFASAGRHTSDFAALFTIAVCAMWPTVLNTAVGCGPSRRTTTTWRRCCGCRRPSCSSRSWCRPRCRTCSPASASASASRG